jgi:hypothetical protein
MVKDFSLTYSNGAYIEHAVESPEVPGSDLQAITVRPEAT